MQAVRFLLTLAFVALSIELPLAQYSPTPPRFLSADQTTAGITNVVVVVDLANTPVKRGVDADRVRAQVEQRLREAGFAIDSTRTSVPVLRIKIGAFLSSDPCAGKPNGILLTELFLQQHVTLGQGALALATTWQDRFVTPTSSGENDFGTLMSTLDQELSRFVEAHNGVQGDH